MKTSLPLLLSSVTLFSVYSSAVFAGEDRYELGDLLCGDDAKVCSGHHKSVDENHHPKPWGMVVYVDPQPSESGFEGIAMMLKDRVDNTEGGVLWADADLITTEVKANHYNLYGGRDNQRAYCRHSDSDCKATFDPPNTSAFNACTTYKGGDFKDWYLPSIFEFMVMWNVAQQLSYGADSKKPYECPYPYTTCNSHFFVNFQQNDYWSSTEAYGFNMNGLPPMPGPNALFVDLFGGFQGGSNNKSTNPSNVRCVRAIPDND